MYDKLSSHKTASIVRVFVFFPAASNTILYSIAQDFKHRYPYLQLFLKNIYF